MISLSQFQHWPLCNSHTLTANLMVNVGKLAVSSSFFSIVPNQKKQVCLKLPTSVDNVALPAFAAECRAAAPAVQQSIGISHPSGRQHQTRRTLLQRENGTERRTPYRYIDPAPHTMWAVPINAHVLQDECLSSLLLFRECCSRCRFQPYDRVIICPPNETVAPINSGKALETISNHESNQ